MTDKIRKKLTELAVKNGGKALFDEPMARYTTVGIGGPAEVFYRASSAGELSALVKLLKKERVPYFALGCGSNLLVPDVGISGVVVKLEGGCFSAVSFADDFVKAGSGVRLGGLIAECCARGYSALEGLSGIPATVGGAIRNNASYKTAVSERLVSARVLDERGDARWVDVSDISFGYRASSLGKEAVILEAVFRLEREWPEIIKERLKGYFMEKTGSQPLSVRTHGFVFKNPAHDARKSWQFVDMCGMRGRVRGGAKVSEKHANFIENTGGATFADYKGLVDEIQNAVREKFGVELETEIEILS